MTEIPYPGLRPFMRGESDIFFGREEQTDQLLKKLSTTRFLSVVGLSGCGKSSLVRAGMIAALESGYMATAGADWQILEMRPGDHPLRHLAEELLDHLGSDSAAPAPPQHEANVDELFLYLASQGPTALVTLLQEAASSMQRNLLLLVDQFEEIFRYRREGNHAEAEAFISLLLASAEQREVPIYVVITMRSDFIGDCAIFRSLPEVLNRGQFLVPRLTREQQRMAIVGPAGVFGSTIEPQLVNRLLNEMGDDADQLPILQHCLMRMWFLAETHKKSSPSVGQTAASEFAFAYGVTITLADYETVGGLDNALSNHADEAFHQLNDEQQRIAEHLFRALSERGPEQRDTRRPVKLYEVAKVSGASILDVMEVVEAFRRPDRCFIIPAAKEPLEPDSMLDIGHESLIRQWNRMRNWVRQESESAALYHRLEETASLWEGGKAGLWDTPDLEIALQWKRQQSPTPEWASRYGKRFDLAMKFLKASKRAQEKRRKREEREHSLKRMVGLTIIAIIVLLIAFFSTYISREKAVIETQKARRALRKQIATQVATQAQLTYESYPQRGVLLAAEAIKMTSQNDELQVRVPIAEEALRNILANIGGYGLNDHTERVNMTQITSDNRWVITGEADGSVRLWDLQEHDFTQSLIITYQDETINTFTTSRNARWLIAGTLEGNLLFWDLTALDSSQPTLVYKGHERQISKIVIGPDARWIVTSSWDRTAHLWKFEENEPALTFIAQEEDINTLIASSDDQYAVTSDTNGVIRLWDLANPAIGPALVIEWPEAYITTLAISPDKRWLSACNDQGIIRLWDLSAHAAPKVPSLELHAFGEHIIDMLISPDNQWLITINWEGLGKLWCLSDEAPSETVRLLPETQKTIMTAVISPEGRWLVTGSENGNTRLWDLTRDNPTESPIILRGHADSVETLTISQDGHWLVTGSWDRSARLWDLREKGAPPSPLLLKGDQNYISTLNVSADSQWLTAANIEGSMSIWTLPARTYSKPIEVLDDIQGEVMSLAFSAENRWLAAGTAQGDIYLWDANNLANMPAPTVLKAHDDAILALAFSAEQHRLLSFSRDETVRDWQIEHSTQPRSSVVVKSTEHANFIYDAAISQDRQWLVTACEDGSIRIWNLYDDSSTAPITLTGHYGAIYTVKMSTDQQRIISGGEDGTVRIWTWQGEQPQETLVLYGHDEEVYTIDISQDNHWLVTSSVDGVLRLWNLQSTRPAESSILLKESDETVDAVFSPDSHWLITSDNNGHIYLWTLDRQELLDLACQTAGRNLTLTEWEIYFQGEDYRATCPEFPANSPPDTDYE